MITLSTPSADKASGMDETVYMNLTGDNSRDVVLHVKDGTLDIRREF